MVGLARGPQVLGAGPFEEGGKEEGGRKRERENDVGREKVRRGKRARGRENKRGSEEGKTSS
jgi:hypothetical protein